MRLTVISLGAGWQSSCMALMAAHGEIEPMPDCAIFADTQNEPKAVYEYLRWLCSPNALPFPVHIVTAGDLKRDQEVARVRGRKEKGERFAALPYFTKRAEDAVEGRITRQCTKEYKVEPIERFIRRELLGLKPRQRVPKDVLVEQWRGISMDEAGRMKPSREKWMLVRYPLAMEHRMTRWDCRQWILRHGYPPPARSACIVCPFHSDAEWRDMRDNRPDEWREAVEFDERIRKAGGMRADTYLHRQCVPLEQVDLDTAEDRGQASMFGNDCEGMCGV